MEIRKYAKQKTHYPTIFSDDIIHQWNRLEKVALQCATLRGLWPLLTTPNIKAKLKEELDELQNEIMNTVESWDIFLKLQNLVQPARHAVESLPPCWDKGVRVPDASDDRATLSDAALAIDDIPTTEEREETASKSCEAVTIMDQSGSNVATPRCTQRQTHPPEN